MENNNEQLIHGMSISTYCLLMNIVNLFSGGGWIIAIVMWIISKEKSEEVDIRGKDMTNWIISWMIYAVAGGLLCFILIGIPIVIALGIGALVCPIIAAIKASNGEPWKYPLTIQFIK